MADMAQTPESVAYKLMERLLNATDGAQMGGATKQQIVDSFTEAAELVNKVANSKGK